MKTFGRGPDLLIVVAGTGLIPLLSGMVASHLDPVADSIDPAQVFAFASVHHACQLLLTLALMKAFVGTPLSAWGLRVR